MKKLILFTFLFAFGAVQFSVAQPMKKGYKKLAEQKPEMAKELKDYFNSNILPVITKAHSNFDASLPANELGELKALRAQNKTLSQQWKTQKEKMKSLKESGVSKEEARAQMRKEMQPLKENKRNLHEQVKAWGGDNKTYIKNTMESLRPNFMQWMADMKTIKDKHITEEDIQKWKEHKAGKKGECKKGNKEDCKKGDRKEGHRRHHKKGHHKGHHHKKMVAAFLLWDGSAGEIEKAFGIKDENSNYGNDFDMGLEQNYPNPAITETTIDFNLPVASENVTLVISNLNGQVVRRMSFAQLGAGKNSVNVNVSDLGAGTYLYTIEADKFVETKKMIVGQ